MDRREFFGAVAGSIAIGSGQPVRARSMHISGGTIGMAWFPSDSLRASLACHEMADMTLLYGDPRAPQPRGVMSVYEDCVIDLRPHVEKVISETFEL